MGGLQSSKAVRDAASRLYQRVWAMTNARRWKMSTIWRKTRGLDSVCRERPLTLRPSSPNRSIGRQIKRPHPTSSPLLADERLTSTLAFLRSQNLSMLSGDKKRLGYLDRQERTCTESFAEYATREVQIRPHSVTKESSHVAAS